jgi:RNA polymerase sigma-70 factor, ECF subfamily
VTAPCLLAAWSAHEAELRGWLRRRLGSASDADDALQDLFVKAMRQEDGFCAIVNPRAWLFEVARNAVADRLRRHRDVVELPDDLANVSDELPTVDALTACLPRVLGELEALDREAITLCDLEGMSQQAYAQLKGLTLPGAKARVQRARKRLREKLTHGCRVQVDAHGTVIDFVPRRPLKT